MPAPTFALLLLHNLPSQLHNNSNAKVGTGTRDYCIRTCMISSHFTARCSSLPPSPTLSIRHFPSSLCRWYPKAVQWRAASTRQDGALCLRCHFGPISTQSRRQWRHNGRESEKESEECSRPLVLHVTSPSAPGGVCGCGHGEQ